MIQLPSGALELDRVQLADQVRVPFIEVPRVLLTLFVCCPTSQGYYRCNVSNVDKYRISAEAKLTVDADDPDDGERSEAPSFLATPRNTVALEGSRVTLECAANGQPRPEITWLKDGTTVDLE